MKQSHTMQPSSKSSSARPKLTLAMETIDPERISQLSRRKLRTSTGGSDAGGGGESPRQRRDSFNLRRLVLIQNSLTNASSSLLITPPTTPLSPTPLEEDEHEPHASEDPYFGYVFPYAPWDTDEDEEEAEDGGLEFGVVQDDETDWLDAVLSDLDDEAAGDVDGLDPERTGAGANATPSWSSYASAPVPILTHPYHRHTSQTSTVPFPSSSYMSSSTSLSSSSSSRESTSPTAAAISSYPGPYDLSYLDGLSSSDTYDERVLTSAISSASSDSSSSAASSGLYTPHGGSSLVYEAQRDRERRLLTKAMLDEHGRSTEQMFSAKGHAESGAIKAALDSSPFPTALFFPPFTPPRTPVMLDDHHLELERAVGGRSNPVIVGHEYFSCDAFRSCDWY